MLSRRVRTRCRRRYALRVPNDGPLKALLTTLWPLHRTIVSDGTDEALRIVGEHLPASAGYSVATFAPGAPAWTWTVPERYEVDEAYLETEGGERIADFAWNALHLQSYSLPVDTLLTWEELEPHVHYSDKRPAAIPWEFRYYERTWGFCVTKERFDRLRRDVRYRAVIRSRFISDPDRGLRVGVAVIDPAGGRHADAGEMIVCAHICHVRQANDDLSGVVSAVELARRLAADPLPPGSMSVRFLFVPETIGSIAWFSHNEPLIPRFKGALFCEMTGTNGPLRLQRSRQDGHTLDQVARMAFAERFGAFDESAFRQLISNDEMVINGPGVNVPCVSISRWPYDEYHTSDDSPDIISESMLSEASDIAERIVRVFASDYVPRRRFKGPIFLSGHGLWVDWRVEPKLNRAIEQIMLRLDGDRSVFDIASELGLDYEMVRRYLDRFRAAGLVEALPLPNTPRDVS